MGSFTSKLTSGERSQLEMSAKQKHVVLIISLSEISSPVCIQFIDLLRPLCGKLSILPWDGGKFVVTGKANAMDIIRSAQKIVLVDIRLDVTKRFDMLSLDMVFGRLHSYLRTHNFDINTHGRIVCCHLSSNMQIHQHNCSTYPSNIQTTIIKLPEYIIATISVNITISDRLDSIEESEAAAEHLLMALEMPMDNATMEPLKKILDMRVHVIG